MKVLFISENLEDQEQLKRMIHVKNSKLEVVAAFNVEDAMSCAASDGPFVFFILDCDLKDSDPNALGLNLMEFTGEKPIFFFGSEHNIKDRIGQDLFNFHNLNETLLKPIDRDDFGANLGQNLDAAVIHMQQEMQEDSIQEIDADEYIPMKIKSFYLFNRFPYDIYMAITTKSYMKIISANKPYSISTLSNYARKNVKYLYIKKDEQLKYLENESAKCINSYESGLLADKDIYLALLRGITILHQYILAIGVTPTVNTLADSIAKTVVDHYKNIKHLPTILAQYPNFYGGIASKSLLTAYFSQAFARGIGWESEMTTKKLVVCAALQDITLPDESMNKITSLDSDQLSDYPPKEQDQFRDHPITAAEIARQLTNYPDIDFIIEAHHEMPCRNGFPNRPSASKLTQMNAVFNISAYVATIIDGEEVSQNLYRKAYYSLTAEYNQSSFKEIIKEYKNIFAL